MKDKSAPERLGDFMSRMMSTEIKIENTDNVNPQHYKKYKLETIDNIQNSMTHEEFIGYLKGNIKKYIDRYRDKGGVEDLKKSRWYLEKLIEVESNETG